MKPVFSKHALDRIQERGASKGFIESIVLRQVDAIYLKSKSEEGVWVGTGKDDRHWTVIFSEESNVIITVRRASAMEVRLYETEINKATKG